MRIVLYDAGAMSEDEVTQKKGLVGVYLIRPDSASFHADPHERAEYAEVLKCHPTRISSVHLVLPAGPMYPFIKAVVMLTGEPELRLRTNCYAGFTMETRYKLLCYGIQVDEFPLTSGGLLKTKVNNQYLSVRRAFEKGRMDGLDTSGWILHPHIHDVLFSQGGNARHQGNVSFQHIMELKMDAYNSKRSRKEGKLIRGDMIRQVKEKGGRFLELNRQGGHWVEIENPDALHSRINTQMYDHNRRLVARLQQQFFESDTTKFLGGTNNHKKQKVDNNGRLCGGGCL